MDMKTRRCSRACYLLLLILFFLVCQTWLVYVLLLRPRTADINNKVKTRSKESTCVNKTAVRLSSQNRTMQCKQSLAVKGAYVFYLTNSMPAYECYIYVLLHQLQFVYPCYDNVDYVILYEAGYKFQQTLDRFERVKLKEVRMRTLQHGTKDPYYASCYLKLEVFSLYQEYQKVLFVDADGLFTKNPSPLFLTKLSVQTPVAAAHAYWFYPQKWLTSSIFVAHLSLPMYAELIGLFRKDLRLLYKGRSVKDMEMFNWLFNRDNRTSILKDVVYMDSHYIDEDYINKFYSVSKIPYYVHFSHLKPHLNPRISACLDESRIKNATPEFFKVHRTFWNYYYRYC